MKAKKHEVATIVGCSILIYLQVKYLYSEFIYGSSLFKLGVILSLAVLIILSYGVIRGVLRLVNAR